MKFRYTVESEIASIADASRRAVMAMGCVASQIENVDDYEDAVDSFTADIARSTIVPSIVKEVNPLSVYELYYIARSPIDIGYIGVAKSTARTRLSTHLREAADANNPFIAWMIEGNNKGDLRSGIYKSWMADHNSSRVAERALIRRLTPQFNERVKAAKFTAPPAPQEWLNEWGQEQTLIGG